MNKFKNNAIVAITCGIITLLSQPVNGQTYNLEQLLKMADTANQSIRNAKLDIEINVKQKNAYLSIDVSVL